MMRVRDKSVAFFALFTVMCCIGRGMKVEHYPIYRVAKCPRQHTWNWPTALNHLIVGCTSISRGGHSFIFFSQFEFPVLDAGGEDWADTVLTTMPLTLRT